MSLDPDSVRPVDPPDGTPTRVAVAGHPLHPMLVTFPIAFLATLVVSDALYLYTGDAFFSRGSFWLAGAGALMGLLAGIAGTVELLAVPGIRRRAVAWSHFIAAVMLIAVAFANWLLRTGDAGEAVWPWGLYLSLLGLAMLALAGWLGGHLVFEHQIGVVDEDGDGD